MPMFGGIGGAVRGGAQRGDLQGIYIRTVRVQAALATVIAEWQNLTGEPLILTALFGRALPLIGGNITSLVLSVDELSGVLANNVKGNLIESDVAGGALAPLSINWQGATVIPPGFFAKLHANFTAATTNESIVSVHAYLPERSVERLL